MNRCNRCDGPTYSASGHVYCEACEPIAAGEFAVWKRGQIAGLTQAAAIVRQFGPDDNDGRRLIRRIVERIEEKAQHWRDREGLADLRDGNLDLAGVRRDRDGRIGG